MCRGEPLLDEALVEQEIGGLEPYVGLEAGAFLPDLVWSGRSPTVALRRLTRGRSTRRVVTVVRRGGEHPAVRAWANPGKPAAC
ncbi:hypothetical protein ACQF4J_39885 [Streptomyces sp. C1-1]|uniref:hypothetical protein n=1 Tax=Streptomyces sp. C1-1 TaxID=3231173 RepID=UPI003CFE1FB8